MTVTNGLVCLVGAPGTRPQAVAQTLTDLQPSLQCKVFTSPGDFGAFRSGQAQDLSTGTRVLLLAHDTPAPADAQADDAWRAALWKSQVPHQVIYGTEETLVTHAAQALGLLPMPARRTMAPWACEKCSDPDCEHQLFQDLIAQRP